MNAQLNSFQQFVKDNQGKLITFLHKDQKVSKVVADIQDEYFTCKSNASDPKIDGFYYFSDCKMVEEKHPLVEVLEKHKVVTLHFTIGISSMFKYDEYNRCMIDGTCLTTSQPVGFNIESVKEAWSIVDGKYTKVYPLQELTNYIPYNTIESAVREHKNVVLGYSKMVVPTSITKIDESFIYGICPLIGSETQHQLNAIKNVFTIVNGEWKCIYNCENLPSKPMDKLSSYFEAQNSVKNACEKVNNTLEKLNNSFDKVFKSVDKEPVEQKITSGKAFTRHPNGKVKTEAFYKDGKFHGDYYEYFENGRRSKFIQYKNGLKNGIYIEYDITNKIVTHKRFKNDVEVIESPKELKILYKGKPKTVEVVNEYAHENGKEYVIIKDITDNGKTKSLFKEYIEWL